jgi:methyl-accepting chemotaxis protein
MGRVNQAVANQVTLSRLGETVRTDLLATVNDIARGKSTWEEATATLPSAKANFEKGWQGYLDNLDSADKERAQREYNASLAGVRTAIAELEKLFISRNRALLELFIINDLDALTNPFFTTLQTGVRQAQQRSEQALHKAQQIGANFTLAVLILAATGIGIATLLGFAIYRSIVDPVSRMTDTVQHIAEGDFTVRTNMTGSDELAQLGNTFDQLLQDRLVALAQAEKENEVLNNSIINLLQAVSQLSQRDLTIRIPVTEDITGPVADALNLLTDETAKVLAGVTRISEEVAAASDQVKSQSDIVISVANSERLEVEKTAAELAAAADAMNQIAELARVCNAAADNAMQTTQTALETVNNTVGGINNTRDTIRETEKRIKRLGERSQEISAVVNIINTIAERTHILALNASMHAASAGEAGRGFAVVADEVQRLAENSREATAQIATLVSNIQTETADTVNAMNAAISQVVDGSRLAEQAGEQMKRTQQSTSELVAAVQQIATNSQEQAQVSNALLQRAQQIQDSTRQTSQRLQEQTAQTTSLVEYARGLLSSVHVFKLPTRQASSE